MIRESLLKNYSEIDDLIQEKLSEFLEEMKLYLEVGDKIDIQLTFMTPRGCRDYTITKELT